MEIQKILYATDLSQNSAYAFRYALAMAKRFDAEIAILHVIEEPTEGSRVLLNLFVNESQQQDIYEQRIQHAVQRMENRLKTIFEQEVKDDPDAQQRTREKIVVRGFPVESILTAADEVGASAIILGTHGKGLIGHTFLGSVAERVVKRSRKPVFVVPLPKGETDISFHDL